MDFNDIYFGEIPRYRTRPSPTSNQILCGSIWFPLTTHLGHSPLLLRQRNLRRGLRHRTSTLRRIRQHLCTLSIQHAGQIDKITHRLVVRHQLLTLLHSQRELPHIPLLTAQIRHTAPHTSSHTVKQVGDVRQVGVIQSIQKGFHELFLRNRHRTHAVRDRKRPRRQIMRLNEKILNLLRHPVRPPSDSVRVVRKDLIQPGTNVSHLLRDAFHLPKVANHVYVDVLQALKC